MSFHALVFFSIKGCVGHVLKQALKMVPYRNFSKTFILKSFTSSNCTVKDIFCKAFLTNVR